MAVFCEGKNCVTSEVSNSPKFFFVKRDISSKYIPILEAEIVDLANSKYQLTGILFFNGTHYWCEMLSTQAGYQNGWYLYDGLARGGKVDYVGNVHQCIHLEYAHIFLYEQCNDVNVLLMLMFMGRHLHMRKKN